MENQELIELVKLTGYDKPDVISFYFLKGWITQAKATLKFQEEELAQWKNGNRSCIPLEIQRRDAEIQRWKAENENLFESIYREEYKGELANCDKWIKWCKGQSPQDDYGINFYQGMRSAHVFNNIKMEQLIRILKQEMPNKKL